jgi:hypothetical protein
MEDDINKKLKMKDDLKKQMKDKPINLIGCDTIVNSPNTSFIDNKKHLYISRQIPPTPNAPNQHTDVPTANNQSSTNEL